MPPELAAALAGLISTAGAVALMAATYYWGPSKRAERETRRQEEDTTP